MYYWPQANLTGQDNYSSGYRPFCAPYLKADAHSIFPIEYLEIEQWTLACNQCAMAEQWTLGVEETLVFCVFINRAAMASQLCFILESIEDKYPAIQTLDTTLILFCLISIFVPASFSYGEYYMSGEVRRQSRPSSFFYKKKVLYVNSLLGWCVRRLRASPRFIWI